MKKKSSCTVPNYYKTQIHGKKSVQLFFFRFVSETCIGKMKLRSPKESIIIIKSKKIKMAIIYEVLIWRNCARILSYAVTWKMFLVPRVKEENQRPKMTSLVLKSMIPNLDLIPNLTAVSTFTTNVILINQYVELSGQHQ